MPRDSRRLLCLPQAPQFTAYFLGLETGGGHRGKAHLHYKTEACFSGEYLRWWGENLGNAHLGHLPRNTSCNKASEELRGSPQCRATGNAQGDVSVPGKKSEKVRKTLKERCKSHEVSQTRACEHYLCIAPPSADGFANNTGGLRGGKESNLSTTKLGGNSWGRSHKNVTHAWSH